MKNKMHILPGIICVSMMFLSACGSDSQRTLQTSVQVTESAPSKTTESEPTQATEIAQTNEPTKETVSPNNMDDTVVMTVDIPDNIPVADENGKIPSSDDISTVNRDVVLFGNFYQDTAGNELTPIEWLVLDEKDGYSLLLSKQIIASLGWVNEGRNDITWAETDLSQWLDNEFFNTAFKEDEQGAIASYDVTQPQNPRYDTPAGEPTIDKVSLLSYQELIKYMPTDLERKAAPTAYAQALGCYQNVDGDSAWWLRSPGPIPTVPEHLASWGNLGARTHYTDDSTIGVRPAIWVETSALTAK